MLVCRIPLDEDLLAFGYAQTTKDRLLRTGNFMTSADGVNDLNEVCNFWTPFDCILFLAQVSLISIELCI